MCLFYKNYFKSLRLINALSISLKKGECSDFNHFLGNSLKCINQNETCRSKLSFQLVDLLFLLIENVKKKTPPASWRRKITRGFLYLLLLFVFYFSWVNKYREGRLEKMWCEYSSQSGNSSQRRRWLDLISDVCS